MPPTTPTAIAAAAARLLDAAGDRSLPVRPERLLRLFEPVPVVGRHHLDPQLALIIYAPGDNQRPFINVNPACGPVSRLRMALACAAAHLTLHRRLLRRQIHVQKTFPIPLVPTTTENARASLFALCLLVPDFALDSPELETVDMDDAGGLLAAARHLQVSPQALAFRLGHDARHGQKKTAGGRSPKEPAQPAAT